jgi:acetylornithine deacetylase/succinyl-diaminopimelate desuccinylase-like protein
MSGTVPGGTARPEPVPGCPSGAGAGKTNTMVEPASPRAVDEVVQLTRDLIRIDTTNTGDPETVVGEREAAEYVAAKLSEVGYEPVYVESGARRRANVVVRLPGADASRGALLVHGHLDVVPADPSEWRTHPFSGEVSDGYLWGRGAVDMKDMVGMMLAVARQLKRDGVVPARDLIFAFLADEEAGGFQGAKWLVEHRPELFEGATEAISEVGGFSITLQDGVRAYLIETAEKGIMWLRLKATGTAGHGSMVQRDNAVAKLAAAVTRLGDHTFPQVLHPSVRELLDGVSELTGMAFPEDDLDAAVGQLGGIARIVGATLRDTANVTMFNAGYKANVVPSVATAAVDGRMLPGREKDFEREVLEVLGPDIEAEWDGLPPVETTFDGALVDRMTAAILAEDPDARTLPYMLSGGTDAKSFQQLGIRNFGFAPLKLPAELDFSALFHGKDERVPIEALEFGTRVLLRLLPYC